ncbi:MAG: anthranilate phosphoribosyltransferase [Halobacteria archaeon]
MQDYIETTVQEDNLSVEEARDAASEIFEDATDTQIGALLTGLRMKGETDEEIAGLALGMKDEARTIEPDRDNLVDTCGTGGDDYDTINVSTTSAIVASSAGAAVAKHGNYSVSSSSGSADVLEELGVRIDAEPENVGEAINEIGIGFLLAPVFHPAMKRVIGPRQEMGIRTVFNVLGPLTNPADASGQVVGVYDPGIVEKMANALSEMQVDRGLVVHGSGLDEIAVHDETKVAEIQGDDVETYRLEPDDLGLETSPVKEISGGTPTENARDMERLLDGEERGAKRDVVLANTGAALYVSGVADTIKDGVEAAANVIDEGDAAEKLDELRDAQ